MTQGKTILLLGAYGLAGQAILRALVYRGLSVAAAGRNEHKLLFAIEAVNTEFPESQIRPAVFNLQDEGALMRELASASVVINAVGPYLEHGEAIARKALETSTHYIDIASEQEHYRRLKRLSPSAASARSSTSIADDLSIVRLRSQLNTFREYQSMIAVRYTKPLPRRLYVKSMTHT